MRATFVALVSLDALDKSPIILAMLLDRR